MSDYLNKVKEVYFKKFEESVALEDVILQWDDLVCDCESGYSYTIFELSNELYIRKRIDFLLENSELLSFEEHKEFQNRINEVDNRFKLITFDDNQITNEERKWWDMKILKYAFDPYCENVKLYRGIDIEKLEE